MIGGIGIAELLIVVAVFTVIALLLGALLKTRKPRSDAGRSARLRELENLKREGLITDEEFRNKRKEIIDAL